jgi:4-hydroxy-2-oxoglutarate aldolase
MKKIKIRGILPPISTPFDAEGRFLQEPLRANLESWFAAGLHGVVVLGSNGEFVLMNEAERFAVWETARQAIPLDRIFIAGAGAESTAATISLARRAAELGADAAMIVTPHYYRGQMNPATLLNHFLSVAEASPVPIILYNVPANTNVDMAADLIIELSGHENIIGVKDSSGNFSKMGQVIRAAPADFAFLAGSGSVLFPALAIGARGGVPALANVAARECVDLYDSFLRGDYATSKDIQSRILPLNEAVTTRWGIPGLKAALDETGYYGGPPRLPLLPLGEDDRSKLREVLRMTGVLARESASANG